MIEIDTVIEFMQSESMIIIADKKKQLRCNLVGTLEVWQNSEIIKTFDNVSEAVNFFNQL